ncbi:acyl-CoA dehydrogenase family protein [Actinomycetospora chiangmaiensis]|uniref:acyl-CoA dehydrogenase family protein n=1 Tax=Actinomycetospora chiangmaiensis TaxID=402650 RepID=UPI00035DF1E9|nr:acyl-CoA dehydrogenase family protein [Actinomycetospora chiangmaiensis]
MTATPAPLRPAAPVADPEELAARTRAFVETTVTPAEAEVIAGRPVDDALRVELQAAAREAGVFGPVSPREYGGLGLDMRGQALVLEAAGRSLLGPLAVHGSAPDDANIELLAAVADPVQAESHLAPLARGEVRSAIAMTEPAPGAGSDPSMLLTRAERTGDGWRVTGRKTYVTGAQGAAFLIVVAATDEGPTIFLVDAGRPGVRIGRRIPTIDRAAVGGHCEVDLDGVAVAPGEVLGPVGGGLAQAQTRLAPSRLTFCMKFLGLAARAHELTCAHLRGRHAFGVPVAELGIAQAQVADSEIDLTAARALVRDAAAVLDTAGPTSAAARHAAAVAKTFVSEAVWRVLDRAVQLHGSVGVAEDELVMRFLLEARAFRIYEGPSEVLRWSIARRALRAPR